ncbi:FAD-dependent oxidoreductase [Microbacterium gorillae]|uniref:FAD-dependent oxidoreductase n=1 Tax=Microbacterium gorillae TaxID=1231063 RepID=UPI003D978293
MKVVIIGGVAGGMSAATRLRRLDEQAQIVVFERGPEVSYANCGLPYYVGGIIPDRKELLLHTPASLHRRFRLDVRVNHDVAAINTRRKIVTVTDPTGAAFEESYDYLLLAVGARPRPSLAGSALPVFPLRTVQDADAVHGAVTEPGTPVVVVGAGYTGLEAAENLTIRGAKVAVVQRGAQVLAPLDPEMAAPIADVLRASGVDLRLGVEIMSVDDHGVTLTDGSRIPAALVVDAAGIVPETSLAHDAGLRLGAAGGIAVDEQNRTSDPDVFAVGDGVEKSDLVGGAAALITMAGLANRHGRSVADVISGRSVHARPALRTGIVGVFGLVAATVGWSEKALVAAKRAHYIVHVHPSSHAGYYPGAEVLSMKLIADPSTDQILGAQIVGGEGVDKRIDVIATAMHAGLPAAELAHLELAYAPQFGSAKDPVNIAGYVAENVRTGTTRTVQWHELDAIRAAGAVLIDVRSPAEFAAGAIPGAVNLPLDELRDRLSEVELLAEKGPLVVHCQVGLRGHVASRLLSEHGYAARNLDGGYRTWIAGHTA